MPSDTICRMVLEKRVVEGSVEVRDILCLPLYCLADWCRPAAATALMRKIFRSVRGAARKPKKEDSMAIYFEDTHNIHERIRTEYSSNSTTRSKHGAYLAARRIVLNEVKSELEAEELKELNEFHERRLRRHGGDDEGESGDEDAEGDDDDNLDDDERAKVLKMAKEKENAKAKQKTQDAQEEKERNHIDVEALIECVVVPS
jgi:hypothetical protein